MLRGFILHMAQEYKKFSIWNPTTPLNASCLISKRLSVQSSRSPRLSKPTPRADLDINDRYRRVRVIQTSRLDGSFP